MRSKSVRRQAEVGAKMKTSAGFKIDPCAMKVDDPETPILVARRGCILASRYDSAVPLCSEAGLSWPICAESGKACEPVLVRTSKARRP